MFEDLTLSLEPAWPWSLPGVGLPALGIVALILMVITVWTYAGLPGATKRRLTLVILLRLLALALTLFVIAHPSLAIKHIEGLEPSRLFVIADASGSMNVTDELNGKSRWDKTVRILSTPRVQEMFERLAREQKIEVVKYQGAESLKPFDPAGLANGTQTDIGTMLHELNARHLAEGPVRGLLFFSDGIDNGKRFVPLDLAKQKYRNKCPIYTFGAGNPDDPKQRKDLVVTQVQVTPSPVPVKTRMTVKATILAPGNERANVKVVVEAEDSAGGPPILLGKLDNHLLSETKESEIQIPCDAPELPDEYKVTVKVESNDIKNQASTYVFVTKEGVSVLWVEAKLRAWEPKLAIDLALRPDPRFRIFYANPGAKEAGDWYDFDKRQYDVIVIGDVAASDFASGQPKVFDKIIDLVEKKKTGLFLLGGSDSFQAGGWDKSPLASLFPVKMDQAGREDRASRVLPTSEGARFPFLQLRSDVGQNERLWKSEFDPLDGMTRLGTPVPGSTVLAKANDVPILVASRSGLGRVLAFGGDSTWRAWLAKRETLPDYRRFWKQAILWLAQQDEGGGNLWAQLDRRRILAGTGESLSFTFGLRGKSGIEIPDARFTAKVVGPQKEEYVVPFARDQQHQRGSFTPPANKGEYRLVITGMGKDSDGSELDEKRISRFLVEIDDIEMRQLTADHEFLKKLANESEGQFVPLEEKELLQVLEKLQGQARADNLVRTDHWPDWRRTPASESWRDQMTALWHSSGLVCFLMFVALLSTEWGLRRWWGWV